MTRRQVWVTDHGVELHEPTPGRPYYRIIYYTPEGVRRMPSGGKDHEKAWARCWEIDAELAEAVADPTGRTCGQLLDVWLPTVRKGNAASVHGKYADMTRRFIRPMLGELPAWPLTKEQVKAVVDAAAGEAASAGRHTKNALGALLTWAHENDWVANPYGVFFPRKTRTAKADRGRKHGEAVQFIDPKLRPSPLACKALADAMRAVGAEKLGEQLWLMVALAASCGVRQGELFGALVDSLDFTAEEWHIVRQVVRVTAGQKTAPADREDGEETGEPLTHDPALVVPADPLTATTLITPPKWGRHRTVPVPELTLWGEPLLEPLRAYARTRPAGTLLFPAARGGFCHPSNFGSRVLKPARVQAAQATPAWKPAHSWHSLRHAYCTEMLRLGALDTDVALAAGHRDSHTTRAMYVGATEGTTGRLNALRRVPRPLEEGDAA